MWLVRAAGGEDRHTAGAGSCRTLRDCGGTLGGGLDVVGASSTAVTSYTF